MTIRLGFDFFQQQSHSTGVENTNNDAVLLFSFVLILHISANQISSNLLCRRIINVNSVPDTCVETTLSLVFQTDAATSPAVYRLPPSLHSSQPPCPFHSPSSDQTNVLPLSCCLILIVESKHTRWDAHSAHSFWLSGRGGTRRETRRGHGKARQVGCSSAWSGCLVGWLLGGQLIVRVINCLLRGGGAFPCAA